VVVIGFGIWLGVSIYYGEDLDYRLGRFWWLFLLSSSSIASTSKLLETLLYLISGSTFGGVASGINFILAGDSSSFIYYSIKKHGLSCFDKI
jgi:hypothetical protein